MRYVVILAVAVALIGTGEARADASVSASESAAPAAARQPCGCREWAVWYTSRRSVRRAAAQSMKAKGVSLRTRRKVRRGIYDWARGGYDEGRLCSGKYRGRICRKIKNCLIAAGSTYWITVRGGSDPKAAAEFAAVACA